MYERFGAASRGNPARLDTNTSLRSRLAATLGHRRNATRTAPRVLVSNALRQACQSTSGNRERDPPNPAALQISTSIGVSPIVAASVSS